MYDAETKSIEQVCRNDEFMEYYGGLLGVESHGKYSWMVHQKGAIRCYDLEKKRFVQQLDFLKDQLKPDDRVVLKILDNGDFWLMWDRGVGYYDVYNKNGIKFQVSDSDTIHGSLLWTLIKVEMHG